MTIEDLLCPECGSAVRLREGASRDTGKLIYACRSCQRNFAFLGGESDLIEEPDIADSGLRTVRLTRPVTKGGGSSGRLQEMEAPSESSRMPEGISVALEFMDGPQRGRTISIRRTRSYLGREEGEIRVDDPLVSRKHAVLEIYDPETVILKDLSSTNGTYLNGRLIDHCKLNDGDELRVGSSILSVLIDQTA